jgi:hypothetical protein
MRRKHGDHDSRITQRSIDLFKLARSMLAQGFRDDSREFYEVANGLHRALNLRPWQIDVLDFSLYAMTPESYPPHAGYDLAQELHGRLVEAAGCLSTVDKRQESSRI